MTNYTVTPEDEYDVFIEDDVGNNDVEPDYKYDTELLSTQQVVLLCAMAFTVGFLNNVLVMFILVKYKGLKHVGNIYLLNLTISNLCFLLPLPFWAYAASHGGSPAHPMCKVLVGLHSASLQAEALFNILLVVVQGHQGCFHVKWFSSALKTVSGGIFTSVLAWIVAILVTLPEFVFYTPQMRRQKYKCAFNRSYFLPDEEPFWKHFLTLKMNILAFVFPLLVFIFCYVKMRKTQSFGERQYDLCKLAFVIMGVFLLMWAPFHVALFLYAFQEHVSLQNNKSSYNLDVSVQVTKIIASTHCCVNPLLYFLLDKEFRKCLCSLFPRCKDIPFQSNVNYAQATPPEGHDQSSEL